MTKEQFDRFIDLLEKEGATEKDFYILGNIEDHNKTLEWTKKLHGGAEIKGAVHQSKVFTAILSYRNKNFNFIDISEL